MYPGNPFPQNLLSDVVESSFSETWERMACDLIYCLTEGKTVSATYHSVLRLLSLNTSLRIALSGRPVSVRENSSVVSPPRFESR